MIIGVSIVAIFSFIDDKLKISDKLDATLERSRKRNLRKYGTENAPHWKISGLLCLIYLLSVCWIVIQQEYILYVPITAALWAIVLPMYLYEQKYCTVENGD